MARGVLKIKLWVKSWCNISSCRGQIKPNEKRTHHCIRCSSNGSRTPPHLVHQYAKRWTRGARITSPTGLHHRRVEDMRVPFSHLTKPFLFSEHGERGNCVKRCQIQKKGNEICNVTARLSGDSFFLIKGPHHNVHKPLPVRLQWSVQSCKTAGILKALALSLLRFSVDHLWLTQLGESTGWCWLLISVSHWLNHWMQYVNEVQSNLAEGWHRPPFKCKWNQRTVTCGNFNNCFGYLSKLVLMGFSRSLVRRNIHFKYRQTIVWHPLH